MVTRIFILAFAILLSTGAAHETHAQEPTTVALLPFENLSGSVNSIPIIMPLVEQSLREKGYTLVPPEKTEDFLARGRIRNTGELSRRQLSDLRREFGADSALLGSVELFFESADNPQWGISARLVSTRTGRIMWAESTGRTGGDFTRILGLGTITSGPELAEAVVNLLFQTLPLSGSPFPTPPARKAPNGGPLRTRIGYRSPVLDSAEQWSVGVTTFENRSERGGAGLILADVLTTSVFRHGRFQVVEPGEINEALLALRRTPYGGLDFPTLRELRKRTGVNAILLGTLYRYNEGIKKGAVTSPEVSLDIRLLDTENGKILWFASAERTGDEYQMVLDFGTIHSMVPLIRKVLEEMLETL